MKINWKKECGCDNGNTVGKVDATNGGEINCLIGSFCVGAAGGWFIAYLQDTRLLLRVDQSLRLSGHN